jgi:hypothetical protein
MRREKRLTLYLVIALVAGLIRLVNDGALGEVCLIVVIPFAVAAIYEGVIRPLRAHR